MIRLWVNCLFGLLATAAAAQDPPLRYNTFGVPGLIDMPVASSATDAELAFSVSHFADQTRNTVAFQLSPRLSASFRYAALNNVIGQDDVLYDTILDRSFALQYRLLDETRRRPAIALGVTDFVGTGVYAAEYIVATKSLRSGVSLTFGLGWGRLAGVGASGRAPFGDRPDIDIGEGGTASLDGLFKGDAAAFGGLHWQLNERLGVTLEHSSDAYAAEDGTAFDRRSSVNAGLTYHLTPNLQLSAQYLYGSEVGAQVTYVLNPLEPRFGTGLARGPAPLRAQGNAELERSMEQAGLRLHAIERRGGTVAVEVENLQYEAPAQAVGRAARALVNGTPIEVTQFEIALVSAGVAGPAILLRRADILDNEFRVQGADRLSRVAEFVASDRPITVSGGRSDWALSPYLTPNLFDPDDPLRADVGVALDAEWEPMPGLVLSGTLRQKLAGNLDQATRMSDSVLPRVRSDFALYDREGDADLIELTMAFYHQPTPDVYARATGGFLEEMFAGVSAEVLWDPPDSRLTYSLELNHVRQRGYDSDFDLLDYEVTTGHASVYWDLQGGYMVQMDAGRYLAGDWGGTLTVSRTFRNGWSLGAFATFTDVSFDEFGEGSFDKGFVVNIPLSWISGQPTRDRLERVIRPVTRDGGARLNVDGRLYEMTRPLRQDAIRGSWGMFWR